jgi:hypothetical protein
MTRDEIIAVARGYLDVPWRHRGRTPTGVDCIGLVCAVGDHFEIAYEDIDGYSRNPDGRFVDHVRKFMVYRDPQVVAGLRGDPARRPPALPHRHHHREVRQALADPRLAPEAQGRGGGVGQLLAVALPLRARLPWSRGLMADPLSFAIATVAQIGISYLFPSEGPRLKDLKMSASTYGAAIPWVFGLTRVPGNMIWSLPIKEHKKKKGLGKGGSYNQYTYSCTFAMGLCQGPVKAILRVWADGKLIYDATGGTSDPISLKQIINGGGGNTISSKYRLRFYTGDEEQLPDSAIIADKGESNAPAYRGLCYILFDDAPLADFGNRIPQVTAEVYVGSTESTVAVTALTETDGATALDTGFDGAMSAFDWDRSLGYLVYPDHLAQVDLKRAAVAASYTETNYALPGAPPLARLLCVGREGSVFATFGSGHVRLPVSRLDPYALQAVATFGTPLDGTDNTPDAFVIERAASAVTNASIEYLLTLGPLGQAGLLRADTLAYQWGSGVYLGGYPGTGSDAYRVCGADPDTSGDATFYVLWGAGATLTLTKIEGAVQTEVQVITGAALAPIAAIWDSSVNGVLLLWTDGGSAFISKWSADTGVEAWRKPVAGLPANYSGATRLLTATFAWVHAGVLYVIDTTTGDFKDKSIDAATGEVVEGSGTGFDLPTAFTGADAAIQAFDGGRSALFCANGIDGLVQVSTATAGVTVGTIVERMLIEGGLTPAQMNLTALLNDQSARLRLGLGHRRQGRARRTAPALPVRPRRAPGRALAVMRADPTNGPARRSTRSRRTRSAPRRSTPPTSGRKPASRKPTCRRRCRWPT